MLLAERETTIRWNAEDKIAKIWTNDPAMIKRMDTLCEHRSGAYSCTDKYGQSATYRADAKLISFRFPTTEEIRKEKEAQMAARRRRTPLGSAKGSKQQKNREGNEG